MYRILLIVLMTKYVIGDDESYEKYIDLLPEKEKQEFLDRIARRILEGIKTERLSDPSQPNIEISDAQLDAQDKYVKDILKEETERLEDEKRKDGSLRTEEREDNGDENKYIDLTLRERKHSEQDVEADTNTEFPYNVIPVKTVYDDPNDDPNRNVNKESKENLSSRIKHETSVSSNISESYNDPSAQSDKDVEVSQTSNEAKNENNLRKSFQNNVSNIRKSSDFVQNVDKSSLLTEDYDVNRETTMKIFQEYINDVTSEKVFKKHELSDDEDNFNKEVNTEKQIETAPTVVNFDKSNLKRSVSSNISESKYDPVQPNKDDVVPQTSNDNEFENNLRKSFQNNIHRIYTSKDSDQNFDSNGLVTEDYNVNSETTAEHFYESGSNVSNDKVIEKANLYSNEKVLNKEKDTEKENTEPATVVSNVATTISTIQPISVSTEEDKDRYETTDFTIKVNETTDNDLNKISHPFQRSGIDESLSITNIPTDINTTNIESSGKLVTDNSKVKSDSSKNYIEITENKVESEITNASSNLTVISKSDDVGNVTHKNDGNKTEEQLIEPKTDLHLRSYIKQSKEDIWINKLDTKPEKSKTYEVFEVAAEKPPFQLLNTVKTDKQPHYVPIYDYAPENAYFRPYDRFGPNFRDVEQENSENKYFGDENTFKIKDENNFNILGTRSRFSSYGNNKGSGPYRIKDINYPIQKGNSDMYGFMKPVQTHFVNNKFYNPYDYFDMDYANGRYILRSASEPNFKQFPDSDESDHPYNSIHNSDSVKDHIRAVKKILYLQKRFGYVPEADKDMRKFDQHEKTIKFPIKKAKGVIKVPNTDKISVDYYYERAHSREDSGSVQAVPINSSQSEIFVVPAKEFIGEFNAILNINKKRHSLDADNIDRKIIDTNNFHSFFDAMVDVLADMIRFDNEALENYDWLRTSVEIQSAVQKLLDLTASLKEGKEMDPKDLELLKYCLYIFKSSHAFSHNYGRKNKRETRVSVKKRKKKGLLPKNRKRDRNKQALLQWKDFAKFIRNRVKSEQKLKLLYDFKDFFQLILHHLNEFHDAIKHIAMITRYDKQIWFLDLKKIYFKEASRKQHGIAILHLSVLKLLDRLEVDAVAISEVNFRLFVENNSEVVRSTRKEFVFVIRVLEELNRINAQYSLLFSF